MEYGNGFAGVVPVVGLVVVVLIVVGVGGDVVGVGGNVVGVDVSVVVVVDGVVAGIITALETVGRPVPIAFTPETAKVYVSAGVRPETTADRSVEGTGCAVPVKSLLSSYGTTVYPVMDWSPSVGGTVHETCA